jgi:DNA-binding MarR family transcriptional regulator
VRVCKKLLGTCNYRHSRPDPWGAQDSEYVSEYAVSAPSNASSRPRLDDGASQLTREIVRFVRGLKSVQAQTAHRSRHGVDPSAYPVLFQLAEAPRRTTELATCLHADTSTVSRQVTTLVDAGLVERTVDPEDRRATILRLTGEGEALFATMRRDRERMFARILADWSARDVAALATLLGRFNDDFDEARPAIIAELTHDLVKEN